MIAIKPLGGSYLPDDVDKTPYDDIGELVEIRANIEMEIILDSYADLESVERNLEGIQAELKESCEQSGMDMFSFRVVGFTII